MIKEILSINGKQTAKTITLWMACTSLIFTVIGIILLAFAISVGETVIMMTSILYILMPVIYLVIGYPIMRIGFWLYNIIARKFGGIQFFLKDVEQEDQF